MNIYIFLALIFVFVLMALPHMRRAVLKGVATIQPAELFEQLKSELPPLVVDLRTAKQYEHKSIRPSLNIPFSGASSTAAAIEREVISQLEGSRLCVLICDSDLSSAKVAKVLCQKGHTHFRVLRHGFSFWSRKRLPLSFASGV